MRRRHLGETLSLCAVLAMAAACSSSSNNGNQNMPTVGDPGGIAGAASPAGPTNMLPGTGTSPGATSATGMGVPCNVATVVSNNCTTCHTSPPSFGAPMALMSLADFHAQAKSDPSRQVYQVVPERINATDIHKRMPPASMNALSMPDLQTLNTWLSAGALGSAQSCAITPKGLTTTPSAGTAGAAAVPTNPGNTGTAGSGTTMTGNPAPGMGGASQTPITYNDPMMKCYKFLAHDPGSKTTPYSVGTTPDMYTNFMFMPEWTGMMYARSFRSLVDNKQVIHHWLFYKDSAAGTDGDVSPSVGAHPDGELMDGWAPGGSDLYLDPDVAEEMPGDVAYTLETHHNNTTGAPAPDASGLEVCVTPTAPPNVASLSWLGTDAISGTMSSGTCTPNSNQVVHIIGGTPHMHTKGIRMTVEITRANGMMETLHDQPFDFNNQHSYGDSTIIMPGDSLTTTCYWNAPASFGEKTTDEMCYFFTLYYPKLSLTNGGLAGSIIHGPNTCLSP